MEVYEVSNGIKDGSIVYVSHGKHSTGTAGGGNLAEVIAISTVMDYAFDIQFKGDNAGSNQHEFWYQVAKAE